LALFRGHPWNAVKPVPITGGICENTPWENAAITLLVFPELTVVPGPLLKVKHGRVMMFAVF
jgi:hypothetical protein